MHTPAVPRWGLFEAKPAIGVDTDSTVERDEHDARARIRCPLCEWTPHESSRWCCVRIDVPEGFQGGCGTIWNTFNTRGRCPGCQHQWRWTLCLDCRRWSLHEDWYVIDSVRPPTEN